MFKLALDAYLAEGDNGDVKKYLIEELHINDTHI